MLAIALIAVLLILLLRIFFEYFVRDRGLPPGPPRLPLIGNLHQAPSGDTLPWHIWSSWAKQYGPIFSVQFGSHTLIMIADEDIAHDLLNRRGNKYSDRPRLVMANDCLEKGMHIMLRNYDDEFKRHQRMQAAVLSPFSAGLYVPIQDLESKKMIYDLMFGGNCAEHFERFSMSVVTTPMYGFRIPSVDDPKLPEIRLILENMILASTFGKWMVDSFPVLNHLPTALAPWKQVAEKYYNIESAWYLANMRRGLNSKAWNWTKEFTQSNEGKDMDTLEMAYNLGILLGGGFETTAGVFQVFVVAAATYPDVIQAAQRELDSVVGKDRLPTLKDRENLPFVEACVKEILRWRTILPGAFPHGTKAEDHYNGYRIPANSIIMPLQWCMNLDPQKFPDPNRFDPERWLKAGAEEVKYHAYGYGRRICPGRHIADNSLFLGISRLLWAFDIKPRDGWRYSDQAWDTRFFTRPLDVKLSFDVRSASHRAVIEREWTETVVNADDILDQIERQRTRKG